MERAVEVVVAGVVCQGGGVSSLLGWEKIRVGGSAAAGMGIKGCVKSGALEKT
jgi:hypothetical protein